MNSIVQISSKSTAFQAHHRVIRNTAFILYLYVPYLPFLDLWHTRQYKSNFLITQKHKEDRISTRGRDFSQDKLTKNDLQFHKSRLTYQEPLAALFHGALEVVGYFRLKLNISFPATGCQKLIEVDSECKLCTHYKAIWPQKLGLTLWMKNGRLTWSEWVVVMTNKASP